MTNNEIIKKIKLAIDIFFLKDEYLLRNDVNERSISHKLAEYLQLLFSDYNVDCEYNRNIKDIKRIERLSKDIQKINKKSENSKNNNDIINTDNIVKNIVYPDIIIHKRNRTDCNLCIIEIKKSTSKVSNKIDKEKLKCYTKNENGNTLNYNIGIFIKFIIGGKRKLEFTYYKDGIRKKLNELNTN